MVDPTHEEESLAGSCTSVVVAGEDLLLGVHKQGGGAELSQQQLQACIQAAVHRRTELLELLSQTLGS